MITDKNSVKAKSIIFIVFTVVLVAVSGRKSPAAVNAEQVPTTLFYSFSENEPQYVCGKLMDSIIDKLADNAGFLFIDLYPIVDTLPLLQDDRFFLAEKLDSRGFRWTDGGNGNWERGPRFRYRKYVNDSLACSVYKAYQIHEMNADSSYNALVYEQITCKNYLKEETVDEIHCNSLDYEYLCGDLLEIYAQKPDGLEFVSCEKVEDEQTIARATYRVSGKNSKRVEGFLVGKYGMGKLKWACCGWDNGGKYGSFEHLDLTKVHPFLSVIINMYASGEVTDEKDPSKIKLETTRNKIDYFTVVVELAII